MKLRITAKLFLVILATCLVVTLAMGIAMRHSIEHGFTAYVQEREARHVSELSTLLQRAYREHGSWDFLRGNREAWFTLLRRIRNGEDGNSNAKPTPFPVFPPTQLLNAEGEEVIHHGPRPPAGTLRHALRVNGHSVGWLVVSPSPGLPEDADQQFLAQQLKATWLIGSISVALAALVAMLLARRFLAPLRRLAGATQELAAGNYAAQVRIDSGDELGQLANDFNALAATLARNEESRRHFMADISHELRTPLAVLKGELEALEDGVRRFDDASRASLQAEVATLSKLIDDLYQLSLSDVGALRYHMNTVNLVNLLGASCHVYEERLQQKDLHLQVALPATPVTVQGDAQRLVQLFNNLLENSLRYTDGGGLVKVALTADEKHARIDVEDSAPGVPAAQLPRIFERLFRLESSRNRERGGAGLGLALSQSIVQAHGGRIEAMPSALGGLRLQVWLPVRS